MLSFDIGAGSYGLSLLHLNQLGLTEQSISTISDFGPETNCVLVATWAETELHRMRNMSRKFFLCLLLTVLTGCGSGNVETEDEALVPQAFQVPTHHQFEGFELVPLTQSLAAKDYEAVMESRVRLRAMFGSDWPPDSFSLQQNVEELAIHEQLAAKRRAFAYSILDLASREVVGCVYINPTELPQHDAELLLWVRDSRQPVQSTIAAGVQRWLQTEWPFQKVAFVDTIDN